MLIFKTTFEILNEPWNKGKNLSSPPLREEWLSKKLPSFDDIVTWEQIYFQGGNLGVYAAWSPYVEIYVITYNLLKFQEVFDNSEHVVARLKEFNIELPTNTLWI